MRIIATKTELASIDTPIWAKGVDSQGRLLVIDSGDGITTKVKFLAGRLFQRIDTSDATIERALAPQKRILVLCDRDSESDWKAISLSPRISSDLDTVFCERRELINGRAKGPKDFSEYDAVVVVVVPASRPFVILDDNDPGKESISILYHHLCAKLKPEKVLVMLNAPKTTHLDFSKAYLNSSTFRSLEQHDRVLSLKEDLYVRLKVQALLEGKSFTPPTSPFTRAFAWLRRLFQFNVL